MFCSFIIDFIILRALVPVIPFSAMSGSGSVFKRYKKSEFIISFKRISVYNVVTFILLDLWM